MGVSPNRRNDHIDNLNVNARKGERTPAQILSVDTTNKTVG